MENGFNVKNRKLELTSLRTVANAENSKYLD
jgi:hypothetical protein